MLPVAILQLCPFSVPMVKELLYVSHLVIGILQLRITHRASAIAEAGETVCSKSIKKYSNNG